MFSPTRLCKQPRNFSRLTGISVRVFHEVVNKVRPAWEERQSKKKCFGRCSKIINLEAEILLLLIYYKVYASFKFLELIFDMDASNICRHLKIIEPMVSQVIKIQKKRDIFEEECSDILVDATEVNVQRPSKSTTRKKFFSGKKKRTTAKFEACINRSRKIVWVSKMYEGKKHDYSIFKEQRHRFSKNTEIIADSGYQGIQKIYPKAKIPTKKKRGKSLSKEQRKENRAIGRIRIPIEHVFGWLKHFLILGGVYRNHRKKLNLRFNIIAGLYNMSRN